MDKEYAIFPGQIKIENVTYFGLDYELTDFVNSLAEQNKKYKEAFDKLKSFVDKHAYRPDILKGQLNLNYEEFDELEKIFKEVK